MKKSYSIFILLALMVGCAGGGSSSSDGDDASTETFSEVASDPMSLTVSGVAEDTECTVTGEDGRDLGSGTAADVVYEVGAEEAVIVTCGSLSAVVPVGAETAELTDNSTSVAEAIANEVTTMGPGTLLVASTMEAFQTGYLSDAALVKGAITDIPGATNVLSTLATFLSALDDLSRRPNLTSTKQSIIKLLINLGDPVLIENVGSGKTISACTDAAVATYSASAKAVDGTTLGFASGTCFVYNSLDALQDLNNPDGSPGNNNLESFRVYAKESGLIATLVTLYTTDFRFYNYVEVSDYLISTLGHTAYTQDDEATTTEQALTEDILFNELATYLQNAVLEGDSLEDYRFHVPYNPSGGEEINLAADGSSPDELACVDSDPDTACSLTPLTFSYSGGTLTEDASGDYYLRLQWNGTAFNTTAYLVDSTSGRSLRDDNYHVVEVTVDPTDYSVIDHANAVYLGGSPADGGLDPWCDGSDCEPFSNTDYRALLPDGEITDNAYLFPTPEIPAKLAILMDTINYSGDALEQNFKRMTALEAYGIARFIQRGMAAIMYDSTSYFLVDHDKTMEEAETLTSSWLNADGTRATRVGVTGGLRVKKGEITINSDTCYLPGGIPLACTLSSTLVFDRSSSASFGVGETQYTVTGGSLTITSASMTKTFAPTTIVVNGTNKIARLIGDENLSLTFRGSSLNGKLQGNGTNNFTYNMTGFSVP